jgi:hypothetical protein
MLFQVKHYTMNETIVKKLQEKGLKKLRMTKIQIENKLEKLRVKHIKAMEYNRIWDLTRETLYYSMALSMLNKYKKNNLNELIDHVMQYDGAFVFKIGNIYPNSVLTTAKNYKSSVRLVKDFVSEVSPFLNAAEQMLFKLAICEEHFPVE